LGYFINIDGITMQKSISCTLLIDEVNMMNVPSRVLMQDLQDRLDAVIINIAIFESLSFEKLCVKKSANTWSIAECIAHLNNYGNYYLPLIKNGMQANNTWPTNDTIYKSGIIGNWAAKSMQHSSKGIIRKMKSPYNMRPTENKITDEVLTIFKNQILQFKNIFASVDAFNINKKIIPISLMPIIKINMGDALRFCVYHIQRHIAQANKVCDALL
jgi:DinB superfamily